MDGEATLPSEENVFGVLCEQVELLRARDGLLPRLPIRASSSVMTDLGFDSITLVELLVAVESALGIRELPMNEWLAEQSEREGNTYRVDSLVRFIHERASGATLAVAGVA